MPVLRPSALRSGLQEITPIPSVRANPSEGSGATMYWRGDTCGVTTVDDCCAATIETDCADSQPWWYDWLVRGRLPVLPRHQDDRLQALAAKRGVEVGQILGGPAVERRTDIGELVRQRIGALGLRLGRPTVVEDDIAVQIGEILAQPLLAGDHPAFFRGDDLFPQRVY